jgi:hypothetical protein
MDYKDIFNVTYLGSLLPNELLMSSKNESLKKFQKKLLSILTDNINDDNIVNYLNIHNKLSKKKLESIKKYILDIKKI